MRVVAQALMFPLFLAGYWYVHGKLALWVAWVPGLFSDRPFQLSGLLFGVVLCGFLAGVLFAGPVHLLYQKRALAVAVAVSLIAGAFDASHMQLEGALRFTKVALIMDLAAFVLALPLCVVALRRLRPNYSFKPTPSARLN